MELILSYTLFPSIFLLNLGTLTRSQSDSSAQQEAAADKHHRHFAPILCRNHHQKCNANLTKKMQPTWLVSAVWYTPPLPYTRTCTNGIMRCSCCSSLLHSCSFCHKNIFLFLPLSPQTLSHLFCRWSGTERRGRAHLYVFCPISPFLPRLSRKQTTVRRRSWTQSRGG